SSYGSWIADTQQDDPASAFDGNPATAWEEGNEWTPVKQWIQIGFAGAADLPASIGIRLLNDSTTREIASLLRVSTAAGSVTAPAATGPMARTFTVAGPVTLRPRASALALPGPGLDALLGKVSPPGPGLLQVSVAGNPAAEPPGFPASLISGSGGMPWTAESTSPVIHLSWNGQRRIDSLIVRPARGLPSTPQAVKITSPDGTRQASIGADGLVRLPAPLTTDRIDVSFPRVRQATVVTDTGQLA